jgi:hypothetical protein
MTYGIFVLPMVIPSLHSCYPYRFLIAWPYPVLDGERMRALRRTLHWFTGTAKPIEGGGIGAAQVTRLLVVERCWDRKRLDDGLSQLGITRSFRQFFSDCGLQQPSPICIPDRLAGTAVLSPKASVVGTVRLIYDHHSRLLPEKLADMQREITMSLTPRFTRNSITIPVLWLSFCGASRATFNSWPTKLISIMGVHHGRLVMNSPDTLPPPRHAHHRRRDEPAATRYSSNAVYAIGRPAGLI